MTLSAVSRAAYLRGRLASLPAFDSFDGWLATLSSQPEAEDLGSGGRDSIWDTWSVGIDDYTLRSPDEEVEAVAPNPFDVFNEMDLGLDDEETGGQEATLIATRPELPPITTRPELPLDDQ